MLQCAACSIHRSAGERVITPRNQGYNRKLARSSLRFSCLLLALHLLCIQLSKVHMLRPPWEGLVVWASQVFLNATYNVFV